MSNLYQQKLSEVQRLNSARNKQLDRLVETWLRTPYGSGLDKIYTKSKNKARVTASALAMQEAYIQRKWKKLQETIASTGFETTPEFLLKVVRLGVANSFRGDIFNEVALTSTDDAIYSIDFTYEQSLRGSTAGQKMYENVNKYYAGSAQTVTLGTGNGSDVTFTAASLAYAPVYPFHARILVNTGASAEYMGVDNGAGVFVGPGIATGTITYSTGVVSVTLNDAPALGVAIQIEYTYSMENTTNAAQIGTVGINVRKNRFAAKPVPLGYEFSDMSAITLETTGLGDIHDMLLQGVADEHAKSRDYKAVGFARQIARGNTEYEFDTDWAGKGAVSPQEYAQDILPFFQGISAEVYDELKRGEINTMVSGAKALTYLKRHALWKTDEQGYKQGVFQAGYLDNMKVFSCPADSAVLATDEVLATFRNPTDDTTTDLSLIFGTLTEISAELHYPELYTKGTLASVEDKIVYNSKYVRVAKLLNL